MTEKISEPGQKIIVVGASAGGVETLIRVVQKLPHDLSAALFVVLHIPAEGPSLLPEILTRSGPLDATHAIHGDLIAPGHIYIAPPDHHLLLEQDGSMSVVRGPKENHHRPAIDPLFRSAALHYGPRVIGVVLTGTLNDGTAGLYAIKECGGLTVVQEPKDSLYPSMPESALAYVKVDYCLPSAEIGETLAQLVSQNVSNHVVFPVSHELEHEVRMAKMDTKMMLDEKPVGTPSVFSCPDCGGVLWELQDDKLLRFRCRVGHAFTVESVQSAQIRAVEDALWVSLKILEENASLSQRMADQARTRNQDWLARSFDERRNDVKQRANIIRRVLMQEPPSVMDEVVEEHK